MMEYIPSIRYLAKIIRSASQDMNALSCGIILVKKDGSPRSYHGGRTAPTSTI